MASPRTLRKKTTKTNRRERDIVRKTLLFKAVDSRDIKSLKLVFEEEKIARSTAIL